MESKIKHLEIIQTTINRLSGNTFLLRGWCITLTSALIAISESTLKFNSIIITFPILIFWGLDAYFLSRERRYRSLYDKVRKLQENKIDFSMDAKPFKKGKNT